VRLSLLRTPPAAPDFKGQWSVIVDKDVTGDELTVALGEDGREIGTQEAHVERSG
jgi:hypothetical protein